MEKLVKENLGSIGNILKPKSEDEVLQSALAIEDPNKMLTCAIDQINNVDVLKVALERGADPNVASRFEQIKNPEIIKVLLNHSQMKISVNSIVYTALKLDLEDEIIKLVKKGTIDPTQKNALLLVWSVGFAAFNLLDVLLENKDINIAEHEDQLSEAIAVAIAKDKIEQVKKMLKHKNIDPSADHNRPLKVAAQFGRTEMVKFLLTDKRVDPSANDGGTGEKNYPIKAAFKIKNKQGAGVVKALLKEKRVLEFLTPEEIKIYKNYGK